MAISIPWRIKPPLGVQVNRSHPIARGMRECLLFNHGGVPFDVLNNMFGAYQNAPTWTQEPVVSTGIFCDAGKGVRSAVVPYNFTAGAFSLRFVVKPLTLGTFNEIIGRQKLGVTTEIAIGGNADILLYVCGNVVVSKSLTCGMVTTAPNDIVIVREADVSTISTYRNGKLTDTDTGVTGTTGEDDHYWNLGYQKYGGFSNSSIIFFQFQTWTRPLNVEEVAFLYRNPYCFMQPSAQLSRYALQAAAAAAIDFYRRRIG